MPSASILDGWWAEAAAHGKNGWVIGTADPSSDEADADALYRLLEEQLIPTYYERRSAWVDVMRQAIVTGSRFTAARMVREYVEKCYR